MAQKSDIFWQIVRTKAPLPRHTQDKFTVLLLDIGEDRLWRGYAAMIESVRSDIEEEWQD